MNTNKKILLTIMTIAFAAVCLCASGCGEPKPAEPKTSEEKSAPTEKIPATAKPKPTKIEWIHSVSEGLDLAKKTGKPAFIDFYADWCPPCQKMDKKTFPDEKVIAELARFVAIKADLTRRTSAGQGAAREYGVQAIPTYVFIDTAGKQTIEIGYRSPDRFLRILEAIK